ncbi:MAG: crotonase, partial [Deltaproteobacteria bacterium]
MGYKNIKLEVSDSVAMLTFNRPEVLNALNPETISEFRSALQQVQ